MRLVVAGKDATQAFFGLHRHEVLLRPQYARLQIGTVAGEEPVVRPLATDEPSGVPYAEPSWLSAGYFSPYYHDGHRKFQRAMRKFSMEVIYPDAVKCEENGKRISQSVLEQLWYVEDLPAYVDMWLNRIKCNEHPGHAPRPWQAPQRPHVARGRHNPRRV